MILPNKEIHESDGILGIEDDPPADENPYEHISTINPQEDLSILGKGEGELSALATLLIIHRDDGSVYASIRYAECRHTGHFWKRVKLIDPHLETVSINGSSIHYGHEFMLAGFDQLDLKCHNPGDYTIEITF